MIEGVTRVLGRSQGFIGLPVRDAVDEKDGGVPTMTTAWEPTPAEVDAIVSGAKIEITIIGSAHPPILVGVGDVHDIAVVELPPLTPEQKSFIEALAKGPTSIDWTCPRCCRKYRDHVIGGNDPCLIL